VDADVKPRSDATHKDAADAYNTHTNGLASATYAHVHAHAHIHIHTYGDLYTVASAHFDRYPDGSSYSYPDGLYALSFLVNGVSHGIAFLDTGQ
jgi:hypothetical protein